MWAWIQWIMGLFFGGSRQSASDQQIGALRQQAADQAAAIKEAQNAQAISDEVDHETPEQVAADLQRELNPK